MIYKGRVSGNLALQPEDDASELTSVVGSLFIGEYTGSSAGLRSVGDELLHTGTQDISPPALETVTGDIFIDAERVRLPALSSVGGSLYINGDDAEFPSLTGIGKNVTISGENAGLTALRSVGDELFVDAYRARLPVLTNVSGNVDINVRNVQLVALTTIDGNLDVREADAHLPARPESAGACPFVVTARFRPCCERSVSAAPSSRTDRRQGRSPSRRGRRTRRATYRERCDRTTSEAASRRTARRESRHPAGVQVPGTLGHDACVRSRSQHLTQSPLSEVGADPRLR